MTAKAQMGRESGSLIHHLRRGAGAELIGATLMASDAVAHAAMARGRTLRYAWSLKRHAAQDIANAWGRVAGARNPTLEWGLGRAQGGFVRDGEPLPGGWRSACDSR